MRTLVARAPTRLDFGGGWTDVPPYSEEQGGVVCNVAISRYATVRLTDRPAVPSADPLVAASLGRAGVDVDVALSSDFPVGSGLGGSSAAGVALAGALAHWRGRALELADLAEESRATEVEELGVAGGRQDHYAAAFGGALELTFQREGTEVRRLDLGGTRAALLSERLVVAYTGQSRISAGMIQAVLDAYAAREARVVNALARMKCIATEQARAIDDGDFDTLGHLVGEHWAHQRALHPGITTERIDAIVGQATAAGALGVKALGASGGGCVLAVAAPGAREGVRKAIAPLAEVMEFDLAPDGFGITEDLQT